MEAQKVVVIQDSATEVGVSFMKWALENLPLRAGDKLTLISVLHRVKTPLGYIKVDSGSMLGANPRIVELEALRIQGEFENHEGLIEISQLYETNKVEFKIEVAKGPSCRLVGVEAAKKLKATLVILDRQMKYETKHFLEKLKCGISRIRSNGELEILRATKPKPKPTSAKSKVRISRRSNIKPTNYTINDKKFPSSSTNPDDDLFSIEI